MNQMNVSKLCLHRVIFFTASGVEAPLNNHLITHSKFSVCLFAQALMTLDDKTPVQYVTYSNKKYEQFDNDDDDK